MNTCLHAVVLDALYAAVNLMPLAAVTAAVLTLMTTPASVALVGSGILSALAWLVLAVLGGYAACRYLDWPAIYGGFGASVLWVRWAPTTPDLQITFVVFLLGGLESAALYRCLHTPTRVLGFSLVICTAFAALLVSVGAPLWTAIETVVVVTSLHTLAAPASLPLRRWIERRESRWRRPPRAPCKK